MQHVMGNRKTEMWLGAVLFVVGAVLIWDAFDNRGKKLPWPLSIVLPW